MKLVFLCTSLAPGRDGVGDYVRQLAAACAQLGHVCLLVALHDRHLARPSELVQRYNEVRFPATLPWSRRAEMLHRLLHEFDPHWVSWQMVPYGFHPKGILPGAAFALIDAAKPWQNHVLLHELWLGLAQADRLRPRLVGALQRRQVLAFLRRLAPAAVHTTNPAYQLALARHGWPAEILPLFGNIPVQPVAREAARTELAALAGDALPRPPHTLGVIFGTIHPQWQPDATLAFLRDAGARARRPVALVTLGRIGAHGTRLLAHLAQSLPVFDAGPHSPDTISRLLHAMDFGLATHPWALIGKSGTAASLIDHGLPIIVPRDDWHPRHGTITVAPDPLLRRLGELTPDSFADFLSLRREPAPQLPAIASRFIASLGSPAPGALVA